MNPQNSQNFKVDYPGPPASHQAKPWLWPLLLLGMAFGAGVCWGLAIYPDVIKLLP
jgi:hypothetical protein